MATDLKESFIRCHVLIVQSLDPELVLPYLQSHEVITALDVEVVDAQKTKNSKCSKILLMVHKKAIADSGVYQKFIDALRDAEELYGDKVGYIADTLMTVPMEPPIPPDWNTPLSEEQRYLWLHHRHVIAESLDVSAVIDWLIGEGVVDHVQAEEIMEAGTMVKRARQLLKVVTSRGATGYLKFREALDHHGYSSLASYLLGSHDDNSPGVSLCSSLWSVHTNTKCSYNISFCVHDKCVALAVSLRTWTFKEFIVIICMCSLHKH